jgi:uncharacterized surface protein with fasciclin (FAS1) repeats
MRITPGVLGLIALAVSPLVLADGVCPYSTRHAALDPTVGSFRPAVFQLEPMPAPHVWSRPVSLESSSTESTKRPTATVRVHLATDPRFERLTLLLRATGLSWPDETSAGITVFAPTNAALDTLPQQRLAALAQDPHELRRFLEHHAVPGALSRKALADRAAVLTLGHQPLTIASGDILRVDGIELDHPTLAARDGVVHPVDRLLSY